MARYTYRARKPTYKRTYRRRRANNGGLWNIAKKAAGKVVKYYLNPEYKFLDTVNTVTPNNLGTIQPLTALGQGDQNINRSGNEIKITSQVMRATITKGASATATKMRVIIFSDLSSNGATPAVSDILQTANQDSPLNRVNGTRFTILADRSYILDNDKPMKQMYLYKKLQHHVHYLTTDNTTASQGQGFIYILMISNEATNVPQIAYNNRFRFLDN